MYTLASYKRCSCFGENRKPMAGHTYATTLELENKVYKWVWLQLAAEIIYLLGPV